MDTRKFEALASDGFRDGIEDFDGGGRTFFEAYSACGGRPASPVITSFVETIISQQMLDDTEFFTAIATALDNSQSNLSDEKAIAHVLLDMMSNQVDDYQGFYDCLGKNDIARVNQIIVDLDAAVEDHLRRGRDAAKRDAADTTATECAWRGLLTYIEGNYSSVGAWAAVCLLEAARGAVHELARRESRVFQDAYIMEHSEAYSKNLYRRSIMHALALMRGLSDPNPGTNVATNAAAPDLLAALELRGLEE
jgi:hypothetical protein